MFAIFEDITNWLWDAALFAVLIKRRKVTPGVCCCQKQEDVTCIGDKVVYNRI